MNRLTRFWGPLYVVLMVFFSSGVGQAQGLEVTFSESELPSETVVPVVDSPEAVVRRGLRFEKRVEVRLAGGWFLDDPFYNNQYFGGVIIYHFNEIHGFGVRYQKWSDGLSNYSKQLDTAGTNNIRMSRAPGPDSAYSLIYENQAFYGKISFGQATIVPVTFSFLAEIGALKYGSSNYPEIVGGVSERFYFNQHIGLNLDLRLLAHQSLNPLSTDKIQAAQPVPTASDFSTKTEFSTQMDAGILYLF